MKKFDLISKEQCPRCEQLKTWLKSKNVSYTEWPLENEDIKKKLIEDKAFIKTFCDLDGCMVYTPVILLDGKYYFKELFNQSGLREPFIKKLLEI